MIMRPPRIPGLTKIDVSPAAEKKDPVDIDTAAAIALAKVNKISARADRIRNYAIILMLILAVIFSLLGYLKVTNLIATQNQRAKDNHSILTTLQDDDKILKTATGPGTVAASERQIHCIVNHLDSHYGVALDTTCPKFDK